VRDLDGVWRDVDPEGVSAAERGEDRVLAGTAADVEERAAERAGVGAADKEAGCERPMSQGGDGPA